uniref:RRM domain-containing protein n=1 Tax=Pan paniscus TaxID=9597 RepID=A0A2R9CJ67_PANPA
MKTYRQREKQGKSTKGPDEVKIKVFVGKIPRDVYEDELVPLFEKASPIWDLRLIIDPLSGQNREAAQEAVKLAHFCGKQQTFVGSILKNKTKENTLEEFSKVTEGLVDIILYHQPDDKKKKWGFCFLKYEDHKSAVQARCWKSKSMGKCKPYPEVMAKVKVFFVRNLGTDKILEKSFSEFGELQRVNKLKDYAFVHSEDRRATVMARDEMNGKATEGEELEIVLAKPPNKKRKERQAARQASRSWGRGGYDYYGMKITMVMITTSIMEVTKFPYYGYDDGYAVRGRGGRGGQSAPPPPRGRGAPPPRGRAGYSQKGAPLGPPRGCRGGRGGPAQQQRGRGHGSRGSQEKADAYNQPDSKHRQTNKQQNWVSQPIAQQPLQQGGDYSGNYGYNNDNQEFYQDTYGQQWKQTRA